ncbi:MAG: hypothetical protein GY820_35230 [Gammaproteobacteria bacterium]|nr:hypothetical protein [Gammaproteobacteria bacterium]
MKSGSEKVTDSWVCVLIPKAKSAAFMQQKVDEKLTHRQFGQSVVSRFRAATQRRTDSF